MPTNQLEVYFDCSSPWTYLGFERALQVFANEPVEFVWKPILVGGLFNTINPSVYHTRENPVAEKVAYTAKDLQDWANYVGIKIGMPSMHPVNSVRAMRGAFIALEQDMLVPYARAVFQSYWGELQDISDLSVLKDIVAQVGLDNSVFFEKIETAEYKQKLRDTTQELADRGGFGSPTLFLNGDDMYFGNDRVELILHKLRGA
ncbi:MAG: 2-hydroxychromene-2-carboxylate isomerase [Pseudomonadota bacterium]